MYINTAGVGEREWPLDIGPRSVERGDAIVISGAVGAHGMAVLSVREGLGFDAPLVSDTAPLWKPSKRCCGRESR
jgi:hydrogenase expression/formation protein HypE